MPRKYVYRRQMSGLLDYHGFRTQTEEFLNDIDGDISAANAKIGNLSSLTTTDKSNLVAAINEAAQSGGGGGGEETFQKVYETMLTEASASVEITAQDIEGTYVDSVVYVTVGESAQSIISVMVGFFAGETSLNSHVFWVEDGTVPVAFSFGLASVGGLLQASHYYLASNYTENGGVYYGMPPSAFSEIYPTVTVLGINNFKLMCSQGSLPSGTTITVYARRKVTA